MVASVESETVPDPREREDWFQRLPPAVQQQTRAVWRRRQEQITVGRRRGARSLARIARESAVLLVVIAVFASAFQLHSWLHLLAIVAAAAAVGAAVGVAIATRGAGRFQASVAGVAGHLVVQFAAVGVRLGPDIAGATLSLVCLLCGTWVAAHAFGAFGLRLELRRSLFESDGVAVR